MSATWLTHCAQRATNSTIAAFASSFWHAGNPGYFSTFYRPDLLRRDLSQPEVASFLAQEGYDTSSLAACIELLHKRICGTDLQSTLSGSCAFPHEIGLFLGYPFEDVMGFIENKGENYLCSGCWKVYSCEQDAKECFCKYKECTRAYEELFDEGVSLECLAILDDAFPADEAYSQAS